MPSRLAFPRLTPGGERRIRREARSATLRERALALHRAGESYRSIGRVLGVSLARARQIVRKAERLARNPHWYDALPQRPVSFLRNQGWDALSEIEAARAVARLSRRDLLSTLNFGHVSLDALCDWLARHDLTLSPESEEAPPRGGRPSDSKGPLAAGQIRLRVLCDLPEPEVSSQQGRAPGEGGPTRMTQHSTETDQPKATAKTGPKVYDGYHYKQLPPSSLECPWVLIRFGGRAPGALRQSTAVAYLTEETENGYVGTLLPLEQDYVGVWRWRQRYENTRIAKSDVLHVFPSMPGYASIYNACRELTKEAARAANNERRRRTAQERREGV